MRVERLILPDRHLAYFRFDGHLYTRDCVRAFLDHTRDPMFDPNLTLLTNAEGVRGLSTNFFEIVRSVSELNDVISGFTEPVTSVIYCPSHAAYGMARVLQQVLEPISNFRMTVTRTPIDSMRAAGQPEPDFGCLDSVLNLQAVG